MNLQLSDIAISIPVWVLYVLLGLWVLQTAIGLVKSYYDLKLARLKRESEEEKQ